MLVMSVINIINFMHNYKNERIHNNFYYAIFRFYYGNVQKKKLFDNSVKRIYCNRYIPTVNKIIVY